MSFDGCWRRPVLLDANGAEFSGDDLVLALSNKDGGAHIDRLNEKTYALVHSNSAGFVRFGNEDAAGEPIADTDLRIGNTQYARPAEQVGSV
ncbi:hypothetical protein [Nocardia fusca]|uniref:Uncharacterized protein n=1 Tax=Nocardia fusca TaxID=941183 RepID=A0ABV3FFI2_9NOCA